MIDSAAIGYIFMAIAAIIFVVQSLDDSQHQQWAQADEIRDLMFRKYLELVEDPTMTDQKWSQWLPVFQYIDELYEQHNHICVPVSKLADKVRNQIDDDCFLTGV